MSNKFVSILKKIGSAFVSANDKVPAYVALAQAGVALSGNPSAINSVNLASGLINDGLVRFQNIILDAEIMGQAISAPGTQKSVMAAPAILQLFLDLPILKGKDPKDADQSRIDAAELGGALAKFLNGFEA